MKTEKPKTQKPKQTNKPPNKNKQKCICSINTSFFQRVFCMTKTGINACTLCILSWLVHYNTATIAKSHLHQVLQL